MSDSREPHEDGRDPETAPILRGMFPDPSICRVGDDYYIANSSMEYSPAAPIWHSRDLLNWRLIGNALERDAQFPAGTAPASGGMYAPTLRYYEGRFYLIGTNIEDPRGGHWIITTADPREGWSDPVIVAGIDGIDPDIAWDDEGRCLVTYCSWNETQAGIKQVEIDPASGALLGEAEWIWEGSGMSNPEGPHLYRHREWWYLLIAEGGTASGHAVTVARARTARGPFVGAEHNPIFTHRSTRHEVQNVGHADFVELADGSWAAVYLGVRVRGRTPRFHVNGRETYLTRIEWVDGWPRFARFEQQIPGTLARFSDRFETERLDPRWVSPGRRPADCVVHDGLDLILRTAESGSGAPSGMFTRVTADYWSASFDVSLRDGAGRMILRLDDRHWYGLKVSAVTVEAISRVGDVEAVIGVISLFSDRVRLIIGAEPNDEGGPDLISLAVEDAGVRHALATLDGRYLSTEVAGGFTGRTVGMVTDCGELRVHEFTFEETP